MLRGANPLRDKPARRGEGFSRSGRRQAAADEPRRSSTVIACRGRMEREAPFLDSRSFEAIMPRRVNLFIRCLQWFGWKVKPTKKAGSAKSGKKRPSSH